MADQSISELISADQIRDTDLFLLEQGGDAKSLAGRVLLNWLTAAADGHGGIQTITKLSTSGLTDTYRITLADTTTVDFTVTNGRGIRSIAKSGSSGLVDTYQVSYTDGSSSTLTVTNGAKGDKGDNAYTWIKYASQQPTAASHSMGDIPDAWMGIYTGTLAAAPTDWTQYKWYRVRGDQGATGAPATLTGRSVTYMASDSGTVVPSGSWSSDVPTVTQGRYLWTRVVLTFNSGSPVTYYSVSRMGLDGSGAVSTVNGQSPDSTGNVKLTSADIPGSSGQSLAAELNDKLDISGGTVTGDINMDGHAIGGLPQPASNDQAANRGYVDAAVRAAAPRNWLDNSDFTNLVAQAEIGGKHGNVAYAADRWKLTSGTVTYTAGTGLKLNGTITQVLEKAPTGGSCFVGMASGAATIALDGNTITITSSGGVIKWAALYAEKYTETTKPEYQPKGYGAELAECQRYYFPFSSEDPIAIGYGFATNGVLCVAAIPAMRAKASVVISGAIYMRKSGQTLTASSVANYGQSKSSVQLYLVTTGSDVSVNAPYDIYASDNAKLELTADL